MPLSAQTVRLLGPGHIDRSPRDIPLDRSSATFRRHRSYHRDQLARISEQLERVGSAGLETARRAVDLVLELLEDPRRFLEVLPEAHHRAVHAGFFGRLFVAVEDGDRVPRY